MKRRTWLWLTAFLIAFVLTASLVLGVDDAWARVGGGQTSRGGSSGGSSSGGGGGEADILFFLIHLAIEVPIIGIPLLMLFVGFLVCRGLNSARNKGGPKVYQSHAHQPVPAATGRKRRPTGLARLRELDKGLSIPVLHDFVQLVHRRATAASVSGDWSALTPFVGPEVRRALTSGHQGIEELDEVVVGSIDIDQVKVGSKRVSVRVTLAGSRRERRGKQTRQVFMRERWIFERDRNAQSLPPADMLRLGCPSCASAIDTDAMGACRSCGTPITKGQLQWTAKAVQLGAREPFKPPEVGFVAGGAEPSVNSATLADPRLGPETRAFVARHPDFSQRGFQERVTAVYMHLQSAWSDGRWEEARPYVTDPMFQTLRFWMEKYASGGLANRLDDVKLRKQQIVKIEADAWYEAITVRIWGSMKDSVQEVATGKVVGGNAKTDRHFSEYWTFLRAAGSGAASKDSEQCPSCGAPLDNVSQTGVCGYCDSKISSGQFDWVLSRIHQTADYRG